MARVIVKNGAVAVSGGRVVTDAGGAPCCCGPGGGECWLGLLQCNCDRLDLVVYLRYTQAVEDAWPLEDRLNGVVARINGRCYRYVGSTETFPDDGEEIGFNLEGLYESCEVSPCSGDPACPPCPGGFTAKIQNGVGGFGFVRFPCAGVFEVDCVATVAVEYSAIATWRVETQGTNSTDEQIGRIEQTIIATLDGTTSAQSYTITERSSGSRLSTIDGSPVRDTSWDYTGNYTDSDPDPIAGNIGAEIYDRTVFEPLIRIGNLIADASDAPDIAEAYGFAIPQGTRVFSNASQVCNGTFEETNTQAGCPITDRGSSALTQSPISSTASLFGEVEDLDQINGDCVLGNHTTFTHEMTVRRVFTLVDGTILEFTDQCDRNGIDGGGGTGDIFADANPSDGGTDAGGPTDQSAFLLGDAVERAIKTITLNQLATCPACQRRKEVLNQFGLTVGRAVLRRLGW